MEEPEVALSSMADGHGSELISELSEDSGIDEFSKHERSYSEQYAITKISVTAPESHEEQQVQLNSNVWESYIDPKTQKTFYMNKITRVTQWEKPEEFGGTATTETDLPRARSVETISATRTRTVHQDVDTTSKTKGSIKRSQSDKNLLTQGPVDFSKTMPLKHQTLQHGMVRQSPNSISFRRDRAHPIPISFRHENGHPQLHFPSSRP